ncbi:hypothetical protein E6W39_06625 [Kitasatospora acidiphila]|uniref:Uncharacterized protein n=2 Tax=Kitasatospora acidiphila TaxID=2567942 RepID=A0A540WFI4_9ACTN|nr:hypothetical protein E6W39_06625 [Kitasatospora acidiphila]
MPTPFITISIEPSGSVVAKGSSDDLSATLLRAAGFREINDWHGRRHRLPTTTDRSDRIAIAAHAAEMLRAARYNVDLDPQLDTGRLTTPTDPHGLNTAGGQILQLSDQIRGATTFAEVAGVLDELLDPDDGVLTLLQEALEAASEQITDLDPEEFALADLFGLASDQLITAQGELAWAVDEVERSRPQGVHADTGLSAAPYPTAATSAARAASPTVTARAVHATAPAAAAPPPAVSPQSAGRAR